MSESSLGFKAILDVGAFEAEEISVKTDDRFVIITGEHEEWLEDNGYVANYFIRRYLLPENIQASALTSNINSEGLLTVSAPIKDSAITDNPTSKNETSKVENKNSRT